MAKRFTVTTALPYANGPLHLGHVAGVYIPADIYVKYLKAKGEEIDEKAEKELLKTITDRYDAQTSPYYAASRLWVDAIIDPLETRKVISMGIEAANNAPIKEAYNPGVIQS